MAIAYADDSNDFVRSVAVRVLDDLDVADDEAPVVSLDIPIEGFHTERLDAEALSADVEPLALLHVLGDARWTVRANAADALASRLPDLDDDERQRFLLGLTATARDERAEVRGAALRALASCPSAATIDPVMNALGDRDDGVARLAAGLVVDLAPKHTRIVLECLRPGDIAARETVVEALRGAGKKGASAAAAVLAESDRPHARETAAEVCERLDSDGKGAVSALVTALSDDSHPVRRAAAAALGRIGELSDDVRDALGAVASDPYASVRQEANRALMRLGGGTPREDAPVVAEAADMP